jgi:solute carrier family 25 protein 38
MAANMQDRGIAGFFSGSSLRISRKAASSAIAWTVYEAMLIFIRDRNEENSGRDSKPI